MVIEVLSRQIPGLPTPIQLVIGEVAMEYT